MSRFDELFKWDTDAAVKMWRDTEVHKPVGDDRIASLKPKIIYQASSVKDAEDVLIKYLESHPELNESDLFDLFEIHGLTMKEVQDVNDYFAQRQNEYLAKRLEESKIMRELFLTTHKFIYPEDR